MCIIDCCFSKLPLDATKEEQKARHTSKALCSLAIALIFSTVLAHMAATVFSPLTSAEILSLAAFSTIAIVMLVNAIREMRKFYMAKDPVVPGMAVSTGTVPTGGH